jgi:hypothetical protein
VWLSLFRHHRRRVTYEAQLALSLLKPFARLTVSFLRLAVADVSSIKRRNEGSVLGRHHGVGSRPDSQLCMPRLSAIRHHWKVTLATDARAAEGLDLGGGYFG